MLGISHLGKSKKGGPPETTKPCFYIEIPSSKTFEFKFNLGSLNLCFTQDCDLRKFWLTTHQLASSHLAESISRITSWYLCLAATLLIYCLWTGTGSTSVLFEVYRQDRSSKPSFTSEASTQFLDELFCWWDYITNCSH